MKPEYLGKFIVTAAQNREIAESVCKEKNLDISVMDEFVDTDLYLKNYNNHKDNLSCIDIANKHNISYDDLIYLITILDNTDSFFVGEQMYIMDKDKLLDMFKVACIDLNIDTREILKALVNIEY